VIESLSRFHSRFSYRSKSENHCCFVGRPTCTAPLAYPIPFPLAILKKSKQYLLSPHELSSPSSQDEEGFRLSPWLISHQPTVLLSQPPATSHQYFSLSTNQHQPPAKRTDRSPSLSSRVRLPVRRSPTAVSALCTPSSTTRGRRHRRA
jgi:hypothetical protein